MEKFPGAALIWCEMTAVASLEPSVFIFASSFGCVASHKHRVLIWPMIVGMLVPNFSFPPPRRTHGRIRSIQVQSRARYLYKMLLGSVSK